MAFTSYAQNFEDVILNRALGHIKHGFYIDVGANDPHLDSVTKAFYEKGWHGINIEPVRSWFNKLTEQRPRDINLPIAAGNSSGEVDLYEIPETGLSTSDPAFAKRHEEEHGFKNIRHTVAIKTLTDICDQNEVADIHFLKIDVEGFEKHVLEGIEFSRVRPWIILLEATLPNTRTPCHAEWEPILLDNDYEFVYFDGLNRFYLAKEHSDLKHHFALGPNLFDQFSRYTPDITKLQQQLNEAQQQAQATKQTLQNAQHELRLVYSSTSWRLTKPLRWLGRLLRKEAVSP